MKVLSRDVRFGFTMIELLVVIVIVVILLGMIVPTGGNRKPNPVRIQCVNRLKNLGLAFRIYATDKGDRFPWEPGTNRLGLERNHTLPDLLKYFLMVTNELSAAKILACPTDVERPPLTNWSDLKSVQQLSYFLGADSTETLPQTFMAGDRNLMTNGASIGLGVRKLGPDADLAWDNSMHQQQGNAVMGDGSVQQLSSARLREQLRASRPGTNWGSTWIIP
jgi:prepilin-type N-terminal cleavage/methylation domain-containing protein